jgi:hypothetical protein
MAGLDPSPPDRPKAKYSGSAFGLRGSACRRAGALRSWTESGRLPYWPRGPVCSIDLGFLGPSQFCPGRPEDKAWIFLDSLFRIETFQWVTRIFWRKKISRALLPLGRRRRDGSRCSYDAETQCRSSSKSNSFSAFRQSIAGDRNRRFFVEPRRGAFADYR